VKILLTSTSLLPAYGGPAYSVSRLALALADAGAEIGLWASDQSATTTPLLAARPGVRCLVGDCAGAVAAFGKPDVLHDNGLWLRHNHRLAVLAARAGIPRVVSTRGMLEPWALRHKRAKKAAAWWLYQRHDLRRAQLLHATAEQEAVNLEKLGLSIPVRMIPNGVDLPSRDGNGEARARDAEPRTALFVGRIYPVKGLLMLVEAWARVRPAGWRLKIAGPDEAGHLAEIERAVTSAGLRDVVSFSGSLDDKAKSAAYFAADLFVLPSRSESFAMVVAEALAHGLPVLTTTATPWGRLAERRCGWSVAATADGIAQGLQQATALDSTTLRNMGGNGRAWVAADFGWAAIADRFLGAYEQIAERGRSG
jgi:glycosyltransferase involved in cell wall biosynthesis